MIENKETATKTVSFFDFGGQCAYYACHQIYLTRRGFYIIVLDASKHLDNVVDKRVCDQAGTVFDGWTYKKYFLFWLESIHTYCAQENKKTVDVVIVATHWDDAIYKNRTEFLDALHNSLPPRSTFGQYISEDRFFCTSFPIFGFAIQPLDDLNHFLAELAKDEERWSEKIPNGWTFLGNMIQNEKGDKRILAFDDILQKMEIFDERKRERATDMLRYYHDAGKVLYFYEECLKDSVIIDVQWFIDSFKSVITDKMHRKGIDATNACWNEYYETGHLEDSLLDKIWEKEDEELKKKQNAPTACFRMHHRESLLAYMERFGLISVGNSSHYVPCMNKKPFAEEQRRIIMESSSRTPVLVFLFDFLPYFLFYRLVVRLMQTDNWEVLKDGGSSCLYNNAALFEYKGHQSTAVRHQIAVAVTASSIQIQNFQLKPQSELSNDITVSIRKTIQSSLDELTKTFHGKGLQYMIGFSCEEADNQIVGLDLAKRFFEENKLQAGGEAMICPIHQLENHHTINPHYYTAFWKEQN